MLTKLKDKQIVYLGIPLPLQNTSASEFLKPILHDCYVLLNKMVDHTSHMTMLPRLLREKSYLPFDTLVPLFDLLSRKLNICGQRFRKCQAQAAHIVFCEQTHLFDPESAMVFPNMRFWIQVFMQASLLAQQLKDMLEQSIPSNDHPYAISRLSLLSCSPESACRSTGPQRSSRLR